MRAKIYCYLRIQEISRFARNDMKTFFRFARNDMKTFFRFARNDMKTFFRFARNYKKTIFFASLEMTGKLIFRFAAIT